jgi:hypothetical protein
MDQFLGKTSAMGHVMMHAEQRPGSIGGDVMPGQASEFGHSKCSVIVTPVIGGPSPDEVVSIDVTSGRRRMPRCHTGARKLVMSAISPAGPRDGL